MSEIKCPKEVPGSPSYSVRRGESQRDISCRSAPAPSWRPRSFPPPAMWGLAGCHPHHSSPHGCFSAVLTLLRLYQIPNEIKSINMAIVYNPKTYKDTFEIFDIGIFHTIHTSNPPQFTTISLNSHRGKPTWPTDQLRNRAGQYMRCLTVSKFPVTPSLSHAGCNFMNFCFDFHQFLLFFIDIFKTLESVTTFIELFQSKHMMEVKTEIQWLTYIWVSDSWYLLSPD